MNTLLPRHAYAGRVLFAILLFNWTGLAAYISNAQNPTESPNGASSPTSQQKTNDPKSDKKPLTEPKPEELAKIAADMEKAFNALEAAAKEIPRDTFDPQAIVDKVGKDPARLFEWVRDNTYWVPYRGMLRGPVGVLMDRLGSSLDRSLLLAELLRLAGHKAQLAHVELTEEQAKQLLPKVRPVPESPLPPRPSADRKKMDEQMETYATKFQLDGTALRNNMEQASLKAAKLSESVGQRVAEQTPLIAKAVGVPTAEQAKETRAKQSSDQLKSLADHWWVQHQTGNDWVNLDPIVPDDKPGQTVNATKPVIRSSDKEGRFALDNKDCHEVEIRVVIEQWNNQATKEHVVLSHTLRPADLIGQPITLKHIPLNWPKDLYLFQEKDALTKLKTTVLAETEWLPVLTVGSTSIAQSGFTDSGDTYGGAAKQLAKTWGVDGAGAAVGGIFRGGKIGSLGTTRQDEKKQTKGARLSAEWIEYEIRSPGQPHQKIRRQIFDLLGPANRSGAKVAEPTITEDKRLERGLNVLGGTEILPLVCQLSPDHVGHLVTKNMLANRQVLAGLLGLMGREKLEIKELNEQAGKVTPLPGNLYHLALARQQWNQARGDVYLDRVNILSYHSQLRQSEGNELLACHGFDIVCNDIAVRPGTGRDPFSIRLKQGVLDTNAESFLMAGCGKAENTAEFFATAAGQGIEWSTIRTARDPAWQTVELPSDARTRIEQDLADGYVILVPRKAVPVDGRNLVGWWRVDPRTGETLGIGNRGWGQTTTEWTAINTSAVIGIVTTGTCAWGLAIHNATQPPAKRVNEWAGVALCMLMGIGAGAGAYEIPATYGALVAKTIAAFVAGLLAGVAGPRFID